MSVTVCVNGCTTDLVCTLMRVSLCMALYFVARVYVIYKPMFSKELYVMCNVVNSTGLSHMLRSTFSLEQYEHKQNTLLPIVIYRFRMV